MLINAQQDEYTEGAHHRSWSSLQIHLLWLFSFFFFFLFLLKHSLGSVREKGCSIVPNASLVTQNLVGYNSSWGVCLCRRHQLLMALWLRLRVTLCRGIKPSTRGETPQFSEHPRVNPLSQCFTVFHGSLCGTVPHCLICLCSLQKISMPPRDLYLPIS